MPLTPPGRNSTGISENGGVSVLQVAAPG